MLFIILSSFPHYLKFKTCMNLFLLLNPEEDILKNVAIDFHSMEIKTK